MSIIHFQSTLTNLRQGGVNVTDIELFSSGTGINHYCGARFNDDGTIESRLGPGSTNYAVLGLDFNSDDHTGEWWSLPGAGIGASYDIRCASLASGAWDSQPAAVGTWVGLETNPEWHENRTGGKGGQGSGTSQCIGNFEIRDGSTLALLASFELDCTVFRA